jgi:hypothetical protein
MHPAIEALKTRLAAGHCEYEIVARRDAQSVDIRFVGPFEGREVMWAARVEAVRGRQCIEIGEPEGEEFPLRVGLNLEVIDDPALAKTVVMIRQYTRLRRGRYEFGPGL